MNKEWNEANAQRLSLDLMESTFLIYPRRWLSEVILLRNTMSLPFLLTGFARDVNIGFPVVSPVSGVFGCHGSIFGIDAHRQHGSQPVDPIEFYL